MGAPVELCGERLRAGVVGRRVQLDGDVPAPAPLGGHGRGGGQVERGGDVGDEVGRRGVGRGEQQVRGTAAHERLDGPLEGDPAAADEHEMVGDLLDLGQQVAGDQDGHALVAERGDELAHLGDPRRVEPVRGLVEHEQARGGQQGRGDAEPLLHAEGVGAVAVAARPPSADPVEDLADPAQGKPPRARQDGEIVGTRQGGGEAGPSIRAPTSPM